MRRGPFMQAPSKPAPAGASPLAAPARRTVPLVHAKGARRDERGGGVERGQRDRGRAQAAGVPLQQGQHVLFEILPRCLPAAKGCSTGVSAGTGVGGQRMAADLAGAAQRQRERGLQAHSRWSNCAAPPPAPPPLPCLSASTLPSSSVPRSSASWASLQNSGRYSREGHAWKYPCLRAWFWAGADGQQGGGGGHHASRRSRQSQATESQACR